ERRPRALDVRDAAPRGPRPAGRLRRGRAGSGPPVSHREMAVLAALRAQGVTLAVEDGDLLVDGPDHVLTDALVSELRARKRESIRCLHRTVAPLRLILVRHD